MMIRQPWKATLTIFRETWQQVLNGDKTETRRVIPPGAKVRVKPFTSTIESIHYADGRVMFAVGQVRCIQPQRKANSLYWRPTKQIGTGYYVWSETGQSVPPPELQSFFKRAEIKILELGIEELGDLTPIGAYREGCPLDCGVKPLKWYENLWRKIHGSYDPHRLVIVVRFRVIGGIRNGYPYAAGAE
jgi:hypothetical protein